MIDFKALTRRHDRQDIPASRAAGDKTAAKLQHDIGSRYGVYADTGARHAGEAAAEGHRTSRPSDDEPAARDPPTATLPVELDLLDGHDSGDYDRAEGHPALPRVTSSRSLVGAAAVRSTVRRLWPQCELLRQEGRKVSPDPGRHRARPASWASRRAAG
jgi:hypothetical protein